MIPETLLLWMVIGVWCLDGFMLAWSIWGNP
jgi:hypothetical protein